jgi:perosamine synthetase
VAVSSGTAALHAAVFAAGIGPGDEVIVPAMTFAATANCVRYQGGTVVFADVRPDTLTIAPDSVERAITPRTRAIIGVDYAGQPADWDELFAIARRFNLRLIDDASHALGARYRGRAIGSHADMTTFSLHPVKLITTGEGGVITTDDDTFAEKLRAFRNHGITTDHRQREEQGSWAYEMAELGYNYRLTDFQCALGLSQLGKLSSWLVRRTEIAHRYGRRLAEIPSVEPLTTLPDRDSAWHLYVVQLRLKDLKVGRAEIFRALRAENIGVNVHYIPVPWHPYYQRLGYAKGRWPVSEEAYGRMLTLPLFPRMSDTDVDEVATALNKVIEYYG